MKYCKNAEEPKRQDQAFNPAWMYIYLNDRLLNATNYEKIPPDALQKFFESDDSTITTTQDTLDHATVESHLKKDLGGTLRDGLKSVQNCGACLEPTWPYLSPTDTFESSALYYTPPKGALAEGV